jgi:hypothetical protein
MAGHPILDQAPAPRWRIEVAGEMVLCVLHPDSFILVDDGAVAWFHRTADAR